MSKSNTPLKISEIDNKTNKLKEQISYQVLAGDRELAVPALIIPPSNIRPKAAATETVSALVPSQREGLMLTNTGAPHTRRLVNKVKTSIILDSGAYSNIILLKFLNTLPNIFITQSNIIFVMADGHESFSMGTAKHLNLWLGGVKVTIDASIFDHQKYILLLGQQTMHKLGVTTKYTKNQ
ncbi:hypothetical protein DSO57_1034304 [Entomophthora muscae]|uniref:Uncharacterized protein n=1 Tax=Entomophthora muscae TaxID=34485 RepID=A0ACC2TMA5_9FUNG|nr:hypothetical protein DSO57_1034304 [Entomophthora muscae]